DVGGLVDDVERAGDLIDDDLEDRDLRRRAPLSELGAPHLTPAVHDPFGGPERFGCFVWVGDEPVDAAAPWAHSGALFRGHVDVPDDDVVARHDARHFGVHRGRLAGAGFRGEQQVTDAATADVVPPVVRGALCVLAEPYRV